MLSSPSAASSLDFLARGAAKNRNRDDALAGSEAPDPDFCFLLLKKSEEPNLEDLKFSIENRVLKLLAAIIFEIAARFLLKKTNAFPSPCDGLRIADKI